MHFWADRDRSADGVHFDGSVPSWQHFVTGASASIWSTFGSFRISKIGHFEGHFASLLVDFRLIGLAGLMGLCEVADSLSGRQLQKDDQSKVGKSSASRGPVGLLSPSYLFCLFFLVIF